MVLMITIHEHCLFHGILRAYSGEF